MEYLYSHAHSIHVSYNSEKGYKKYLDTETLKFNMIYLKMTHTTQVYAEDETREFGN